MIAIEELASLELSPPGAAAAAVYDRPIGLHLLYENPATGEEHYVVRYPPGVRARAHRHTAAHTMVVLEGLLDANGRIVGPGSYVQFAGGETMTHRSGGDEPCVFVLIFHGPFDVQIVDA
jgi:quercetin dioxygenase-like cupin family protein